MTSGDRDRAGRAPLSPGGPGDRPEHPRRSARTTQPGWLADTGRFRRIGSALSWVGERVVVVGPDPDGTVAAMAAELPTEPDVVTVIGPVHTADDRSVVETVLPIAVPPGSRARVVVPGAGGAFADRLARELTAVLDAPRGQVLLVPGGSLFAVEGWLRHSPDGTATPLGRRSPAPPWESDVDEFCVSTAAAAGDLVVLPIPAGMWLFRRPSELPAPELDDVVYGIPADATRPLLVLGRPGQPDPTGDELAALLRGLAPRLRRHLVLAPYGSATATATVAGQLARTESRPVTIHTGLPVLALHSRPSSLAVDEPAGGWEPLATALRVAPDGTARPSGPVPGLDGYPSLGDHLFRLNEQWVAEVTQSGLWVRPAGQETRAEVVRAHPWDYGKVRIFVGVPGRTPTSQVLPLLGALLARLPEQTRRRVELAPAGFADAAGIDLSAALAEGATGVPAAIRRALVLREPSPDADVPAPAETALPAPAKPPAEPEPRPSGRRRPSGPRVAALRPAAGPPPVPVVLSTVTEVEPTAGQLATPPNSAPIPANSAVPATHRLASAGIPAPPADRAVPTEPLTVLPDEFVARNEPVAVSSDELVVPVAVPSRDPAPLAAENDRQGEMTVLLPVVPPGGGRWSRSRRRAVPVLAAVSALAIATATGYALRPTSDRSDLPPQNSQDALPPPAGPLSPAPPMDTVESGPTDTATPTAVPSTANPSTTGPAIAVPSAPATRTTTGPASSRPSPAAGTGRPPTPTQSRATPRPATSSAPVGRVNSSGRNLASTGTATASSVEATDRLGAHRAIDGDPETRWASAFAPDPQWLAVDLGETWQVSQVRLRWERAYATAYRVEVSTDGRSWQTVYRTSSGAGGVVDISFARTPARHVRMVGTARDMPGYGYSVYEFEVR
ncbi:hypothetical protein E0H26_14380 [Micromonospora zingiberis]|uniref:F5/8 type C domain-containing protein n=1 Tax=Micromonospora zingiberis TaxID=2053011 RepID=A0A4R0GML2_9ACTN|nr:discoidin domain-containing protein [Micromonospora zingiberis]TCB96799.1 hypothetical protein E0H26_14380 [Micromonospora zingiberis]